MTPCEAVSDRRAAWHWPTTLPVLLLVALMAMPANAQPVDPPDDGQPSTVPGARREDDYTFYVSTEVSVQKFIEMVAAKTRKIFIYDPSKLEGKTVYILAQGARVPEAAEFNLLQALLKQIGMTITHFGEDTDDNVRIYEIKEFDEAGRQMHGIGTGAGLGDLRETANFVTMVVHLEYAEPASVQRALLNLVTRPGGVIQPITGVNAVLISDFEFQIKRMARLLALLDQPGPQMEMAVIPVEFADATEIATKVGNLARARLQAQARARQAGGSEEQILIEADERTNTIIVQALPENIRMIRSLVRRLDVEIPNEVKGRIHIYFCKHADAEELQTVLDSLISAEVFTGDDVGGGGEGVPGQPQPRPRPRFNDDDSEYSPTVVADANTNSLIITATAEDYLEIRKVISQLDVRKPQVMIEAAILEVNAEENLEFGIELAQIDEPADGQASFFGGTSFGLSDIVDEDGIPIASGGGIPAGRLPRFSDGVTAALSVGSFFNIPILLRATQTQTHANVLSQPRVITNDNEEAALVFTRGEPTITSTTTRTSTDRTGFAGYEDAGINFTITPSIASEAGGEYLRLQIDLQVESFTSRPANIPAEAPPPKNTREIRGSVTIPNNSTIVLGGLTSTQATKTVKKIPLLSDIPVLGELFKFEQTQQSRTNLYIFIRAVILRDEDFGDLREMSNRAIDDAEADVSDTLTPQHREFFSRARMIDETFEDNDVGRMRRRHGFIGVNADFEQRYDDYRETAEARRMNEEADAAGH